MNLLVMNYVRPIVCFSNPPANIEPHHSGIQSRSNCTFLSNLELSIADMITVSKALSDIKSTLLNPWCKSIDATVNKKIKDEAFSKLYDQIYGIVKPELRPLSNSDKDTTVNQSDTNTETDTGTSVDADISTSSSTDSKSKNLKPNLKEYRKLFLERDIKAYDCRCYCNKSGVFGSVRYDLKDDVSRSSRSSSSTDSFDVLEDIQMHNNLLGVPSYIVDLVKDLKEDASSSTDSKSRNLKPNIKEYRRLFLELDVKA